MTATSSTSVNPATPRFHWLWLLLGLAAIQLLIAACFILLPIRSTFPLQDKLFHLLAHAAAAWWFFMLYRMPFERRALLLLLLALAIFDETLQALTPYHSVETLDALANVTGIVLGRLLAQSRAGGLLAWLDRALDHFLASSFKAWRIDDHFAYHDLHLGRAGSGGQHDQAVGDEIVGFQHGHKNEACRLG